MGALPLSKRADADAKDVKDRLDKLSGNITEAAEKVHTQSDVLISPLLASHTLTHRYHCIFFCSHHLFISTQLQETQDTTNQVRKAAEELSNKMKQTRDELEDDLKDLRDVVKELKDFLSGKDCFNTQDAYS